MRNGIVVAAPCKINLHLNVLNRRPDGFHELESVFQALSFGDELRIESLKECSVCELQMEGSVPKEQNIVYKAVNAFRSHTAYSGGLRISIDKQVPLGAGLGGGSSDAAAALLALNQFSGCGLSLSELSSIAAKLGSDVPFFLSGGTALVHGRGERIQSLDLDFSYGVVLVNPGFHSDTACAFRLLDETREATKEEKAFLGEEAIIEALRGPVAEWPFFNDFLSPLSKSSTMDGRVYGQILKDLRDQSADFVGLSGSGSTCFGVFEDLSRLDRVLRQLSSRWKFVQSALPLARTGFAVLE